jgi:hypothetical protein
VKQTTKQMVSKLTVYLFWSAIAVSIAIDLVMIEQRYRVSKEVGPSYDFPLHYQSGSPFMHSLSITFAVKWAHTSVAGIQHVFCFSLAHNESHKRVRVNQARAAPKGAWVGR